MSRKSIKKPVVEIVKPMTLDEVKDHLKKTMTVGDSPRDVFRKITEDILPELKSGKELNDKQMLISRKAMMIMGLETNVPVAQQTSELYLGLLMEFTDNLMKEYDCQNASEKALAQVIAISYGKILEYGQQMRVCLSLKGTNREITDFYRMLSKELDRANRQFLFSLQTLKQLKSPSPELNIRAKNAFIAQNQQINGQEIIKDVKNETIES